MENKVMLANISKVVGGNLLSLAKSESERLAWKFREQFPQCYREEFIGITHHV